MYGWALLVTGITSGSSSAGIGYVARHTKTYDRGNIDNIGLVDPAIDHVILNECEEKESRRMLHRAEACLELGALLLTWDSVTQLLIPDVVCN